MVGKINYQEMKIAGEAIPLIRVRLKKLLSRFSKRPRKEQDTILVVSNCIIGDFLSYIPAIRELIKESKKRVDIIVSPPVKPIAERIRGIGKVWVAKSSYKRGIEGGHNSEQNLPREYGSLIILRISQESYTMIKRIIFSEIAVSDWIYLKYVLHLLRKTLLRKPIKQSRELAFEMVGMKKDLEEIDKSMDIDDIFIFKKQDSYFFKNIPDIKTKEKMILIHTGSGWQGRLWGNWRWAELLERINKLGKFRFIFVGGTDQEKEAFNRIEGKVDFKIYSVISKIDLKELFLLMKKSYYFIGVDSGPRNLAHLANLRSISLRGPGTYFMPLNKKDIVIDRLNGLSASPFFSRKKHLVDNIEAKEVLNAFKKILKEK